jgi:hypothetical protein
MMNNVLINEDINQHNVQYLLRIEVQETKTKREKKIKKKGSMDLLCKQ